MVGVVVVTAVTLGLGQLEIGNCGDFGSGVGSSMLVVGWLEGHTQCGDWRIEHLKARREGP